MSVPTSQTSLPSSPSPVAHGPLTINDFVVYQGASGDLAAIHHDPDVAIAAGYDRPFAPGMYPAGLLASWATSWLGANNIRAYRVRFVGMVWPGDVLVCHGRVLSSVPGSTETVVELELEATVGDQVVLRGWATFSVAAAELV